MTKDYWKYVSRKPRHKAAASTRLSVDLQRTATKEPGLLQAELVDFSRSGFLLRTAVPLQVHESIVGRLQNDEPEIDLTLPAEVCWREREEDGSWLSGCQSTRQIDWETLGELFLSGILLDDAPLHETS